MTSPAPHADLIANLTGNVGRVRTAEELAAEVRELQARINKALAAISTPTPCPGPEHCDSSVCRVRRILGGKG